MNKIIGIAIGALIGWVIEQAAQEILEDMGVPDHTAKVAGAVVGAIVA